MSRQEWVGILFLTFIFSLKMHHTSPKTLTFEKTCNRNAINNPMA